MLLTLILTAMIERDLINIDDGEFINNNNLIDEDVDIDMIDCIDFDNLNNNDDVTCLTCTAKSERQCYSCKQYIYR